MALDVLVGTYQYTYGAGNTPNRALEFYGDGEKIWGVVKGKTNGSWQHIGNVNECDMILEGASTTRKMQIMLEARQTFKNAEYPPDKRFDQISYDIRLKVIESLQPSGHYRITITNNIGDNPYFEKVEKLTFFDPS